MTTENRAHPALIAIALCVDARLELAERSNAREVVAVFTQHAELLRHALVEAIVATWAAGRREVQRDAAEAEADALIAQARADRAKQRREPTTTSDTSSPASSTAAEAKGGQHR